MKKDLQDYNSGRDGNPFASGWGQVGYEQRLAEQERQKQNSLQLDRLRNTGSGQGVSGRANFIILAILAGVFAIFGGELGAPENYRMWAGGGAIGAVIIAGFFWEPFCKLVRISLVIAAIGTVAYLALNANR